MSNETDLDWLARNVHEWPAETDFVFVGTGISHGNMGWYPADYCFSKSSLVTKYQWLARRAELQNKPSWNDAPEWAEWLGQVCNGQWFFCTVKPEEHKDGGSWFAAGLPEVTLADKGEVLGDWRDTLEKRPKEFKQFTSIEGNQERDMKQDNKWFERGELPPVGGRCVLHAAENNGEEVMFIGVTSDSCPVFETAQKRVFVERGEYKFTPIRNERDVLIEIIKKTDDTDDRIADAILAAGFSLRGK